MVSCFIDISFTQSGSENQNSCTKRSHTGVNFEVRCQQKEDSNLSQESMFCFLCVLRSFLLVEAPTEYAVFIHCCSKAIFCFARHLILQGRQSHITWTSDKSFTCGKWHAVWIIFFHKDTVRKQSNSCCCPYCEAYRHKSYILKMQSFMSSLSISQTGEMLIKFTVTQREAAFSGTNWLMNTSLGGRPGNSQTNDCIISA